jgi:hypothetical protein
MHIGYSYFRGNKSSLVKSSLAKSSLAESSLAKSSLAMAVATLFAATPLALMPTQASAFDVNGLIAMAAAHYVAGGYRLGSIGGGSHARTHVAARHSRHSDDDDADSGPPSERLPPARQEIGGPQPRLDGERFKPTLASGRTNTEEPAFAPSR